MSNCPDGTTDTSDQKTGAIVGMSMMTVIFVLFLLVWYFLDYRGKPIINKKGQIKLIKVLPASQDINGASSLIKKITSTITLPLIIAVMCSGLVIGFNTLIMTPLVNTVFPSQTFANPIDIPGTGSTVNPGGFFVALIGFLISLFLLFIIFQFINHFSTKASNLFNLENVSLCLVFLLFFGLLVWNAVVTDKVLKQPDCIPTVSQELRFPMSYTQYLTKPKSVTKTTPLPAFGTFG